MSKQNKYSAIVEFKVQENGELKKIEKDFDNINDAIIAGEKALKNSNAQIAKQKNQVTTLTKEYNNYTTKTGNLSKKGKQHLLDNIDAIDSGKNYKDYNNAYRKAMANGLTKKDLGKDRTKKFATGFFKDDTASIENFVNSNDLFDKWAEAAKKQFGTLGDSYTKRIQKMNELINQNEKFEEEIRTSQSLYKDKLKNTPKSEEIKSKNNTGKNTEVEPIDVAINITNSKDIKEKIEKDISPIDVKINPINLDKTKEKIENQLTDVDVDINPIGKVNEDGTLGNIDNIGANLKINNINNVKSDIEKKISPINVEAKISDITYGGTSTTKKEFEEVISEKPTNTNALKSINEIREEAISLEKFINSVDMSILNIKNDLPMYSKDTKSNGSVIHNESSIQTSYFTGNKTVNKTGAIEEVFNLNKELDAALKEENKSEEKIKELESKLAEAKKMLATAYNMVLLDSTPQDVSIVNNTLDDFGLKSEIQKMVNDANKAEDMVDNLYTTYESLTKKIYGLKSNQDIFGHEEASSFYNKLVNNSSLTHSPTLESNEKFKELTSIKKIKTTVEKEISSNSKKPLIEFDLTANIKSLNDDILAKKEQINAIDVDLNLKNNSNQDENNSLNEELSKIYQTVANESTISTNTQKANIQSIKDSIIELKEELITLKNIADIPALTKYANVVDSISKIKKQSDIDEIGKIIDAKLNKKSGSNSDKKQENDTDIDEEVEKITLDLEEMQEVRANIGKVLRDGGGLDVADKDIAILSNNMATFVGYVNEAGKGLNQVRYVINDLRDFMPNANGKLAKTVDELQEKFTATSLRQYNGNIPVEDLLMDRVSFNGALGLNNLDFITKDSNFMFSDFDIKIAQSGMATLKGIITDINGTMYEATLATEDYTKVLDEFGTLQVNNFEKITIGKEIKEQIKYTSLEVEELINKILNLKDVYQGVGADPNGIKVLSNGLLEIKTNVYELDGQLRQTILTTKDFKNAFVNNNFDSGIFDTKTVTVKRPKEKLVKQEATKLSPQEVNMLENQFKSYLSNNSELYDGTLEKVSVSSSGVTKFITKLTESNGEVRKFIHTIEDLSTAVTKTGSVDFNKFSTSISTNLIEEVDKAYKYTDEEVTKIRTLLSNIFSADGSYKVKSLSVDNTGLSEITAQVKGQGDEWVTTKIKAENYIDLLSSDMKSVQFSDNVYKKEIETNNGKEKVVYDNRTIQSWNKSLIDAISNTKELNEENVKISHARVDNSGFVRLTKTITDTTGAVQKFIYESELLDNVLKNRKLKMDNFQIKNVTNEPSKKGIENFSFDEWEYFSDELVKSANAFNRNNPDFKIDTDSIFLAKDGLTKMNAELTNQEGKIKKIKLEFQSMADAYTGGELDYSKLLEGFVGQAKGSSTKTPSATKKEFLELARDSSFDINKSSVLVDNNGVIEFTKTVKNAQGEVETLKYKIVDLSEAINSNGKLDFETFKDTAISDKELKGVQNLIAEYGNLARKKESLQSVSSVYGEDDLIYKEINDLDEQILNKEKLINSFLNDERLSLSDIATLRKQIVASSQKANTYAMSQVTISELGDKMNKVFDKVEFDNLISSKIKGEIANLEVEANKFYSALENGNYEGKNGADALKASLNGVLVQITKLNSEENKRVSKSLGRYVNTVSLKNNELNPDSIDAALKYIYGMQGSRVNTGTIKTNSGGKITAQLDAIKDGKIQKKTVSLDLLVDAEKRSSIAIRELTSSESDYQSRGSKMAASFKDKLASLAQYVTGIQLVMKAWQEIVRGFQSVSELDSQLTTINQTMSVTSEELGDLKSSSIKMAQDLHSTATDVLDAVAIYANANETAESILNKATPTVMLANASGSTTEEASSQIQSVVNQFDELEGQERRVVNSYERISAGLAINFQDGITGMAEAVQNAGSLASEAGLSFEKFAAIVGKVQEVTRSEGSQIGNQMKTIFSRISRSQSGDTDVTDEDRSKASKALKETAGISVYDENGKLQDLDITLTQLSEKWNTLTDSEKNYVAEQAAGVRNINAFKVAIQEYASATELANSAMQDTDFIDETQEKYEDSINAKLARLQSELTEFWNTLINSDVLKSGIDFLANIFDFIQKIISSLSSFGSIFGSFGEWAVSLGVIGGSLTGIYVALQKIRDASDTAKVTKELNTFLERANKMAEIEAANLAMKKANNAEDEKDIATDIAQAASQEAVNRTVSEETIELGKNTAEKKINNAADIEDIVTDSGKEGTGIVGGITKAFTNFKNASTKAGGGIKGLKSGIGAAISGMSTMTKVLGGVGIALTVASVAVKVFKDNTTTLAETAESAENAKKSYDEMQTSLKNTKTTIKSVSSDYEELSKGVDKNGKNISLTSDEFERYQSICETLVGQFPDMLQGFNNEGNYIMNLKGDVDKLNDAYEKLAYNKAVDWLGENEGASQEQIDKMNGKVSFGDSIADYWERGIGNTNASNVTAKEQQEWLEELINSDYESYKKIATRGGKTYKDNYLDNELGLKTNRWTSGLEVTEEEFKNIQKFAITKLNGIQEQFQAAVNGQIQTAQAYLTKITYEDTGNGYDETKDLTNEFLGTLNKEDLDKLSDNGTTIEAYVHDIANKIKDSTELQEALTNVLSIDENTSIDNSRKIIDENIKVISKTLGESEEDLKIRLGFNDEELNKRYDELLKNLKEKASKKEIRTSVTLEAGTKLNNIDSNTDVDLMNRATATLQDIKNAGWKDATNSSSTLSQTYSNEDGSKAVVVTPILPNGSVLTPNELDKYAKQLLDGKEIDVFEGAIDYLKGQQNELAKEWNNVTNGNVDYLKRNIISAEQMWAKGWDQNHNTLDENEVITTFDSGYYASDFGDDALEVNKDLYVSVTPILDDGTILTPKELDSYVAELYQQEDMMQYDKEHNSIIESILPSDTDVDEFDKKLSEIKDKHAEFISVINDINSIKANSDLDDTAKKSQIKDYLSNVANDDSYNNEVKNEINNVLSSYDTSDFNVDIKLGEFSGDEAAKEAKSFASSLDEVADAYYGLSNDDYTSLISSLGLNDIDQITAFNKCLEDTDSILEAIVKYKDTQLTLFDSEELSKQLETMKTGLSQAKSIKDSITKFRSGEMTSSDAAGLIEDFPELLQYINLADGGFNNLDDALELFKNQKIDNQIEALKGMKGATEEEQVALDNLIISLQSMKNTSLDDLATSLSGIANSAKGLTSAMDQLAKGTALTKGQMVDLVMQYPKMLEQENMFTDASIDGQKNLLNTQLDMLEQKYDATIDEKINELKSDNEVSQAQLDVEKQKMETLLEMEAEIANGTLTTREQLMAYLNNLAKLQLENNIIEGQREVDIAAETETKKNEATKEGVEKSVPYYQAEADLMAEASSKGGEAFGSNLDKILSAVTSWAKQSKSLIAQVWLAFTSKDEAESNTTGGSASVKGLLGSANTISSDFLNADGTVNPKVLGDWTASFKDAVSNSISKYQAAIDKNNIVISNLEHLKGLSLQTVNSGSNSSSGSGSSESSEQIDGIAIAIDRLERKIQELGKVADSVYRTWSNRNNALNEELGQVQAEIELQTAAYNAYMSSANSIGLSEDWKNKIKNGFLGVEEITNDDLKEKVKSFQSLYESALSCQDKIADLKEDVSKLATDKFNNVVSEYEQSLTEIEHRISMINSGLDLVEKKGQFASSNYYSTLISIEQENIRTLQQEYSSLQSAMSIAMSEGSIQEGSEGWASMRDQINSVTEAILEAQGALVDYQNQMREMDWSVFDKQIEYINQITTESNFLIDLLTSNEAELYDKKSGNWTDKATAAGGLHAMNYNTYMAQADEYAAKVEEINKEIANDPYNTKLVDKKYEYIQAQQEAIKSAQGEKQAIVDLTKNGYDVLLKSLQEIIDKRKEFLNSEKSLFEYQVSIADQTKNITDIKKQLLSLQGDTSESSLSKQQSLNENLKKAEQELQQSEYERYLEDQTKLLDDLYDNYEQLLNERLDGQDELLRQMIDTTNQKSDEINQIIQDVTTGSDGVGYTLTEGMKNIWNTTGSGIGKVVSDYSSNFSNTMTTTNSYIKSCVDYLKQVVDKANEQSSTNTGGTVTPTTGGGTSGGGGNTSGGNSGSTSGSTGGTGSNGTGHSFLVHKSDSYPKNKLNKQMYCSV